MAMAEFVAKTNHTHGRSAASRNEAVAFAVHLGSLTGMEPHFVQMSAANQREGLKGDRTYHWAKDLVAQPRLDAVGEHTMVSIIDTDYYLDMPHMLSRGNNPHLLYTFVPEQAGRDAGEYAYTFLETGEVKYTVSGGASYTHLLWSYEADTLLAVERACWFPWRAAAYLVDRRRVSPDHFMVLLTPIRTWGPLSAWFTWWLEAPRLSRLNPVVGKHVRIDIMAADGLYRSTGCVGAYVQACVRASVDDTVAVKARTGAVPITIPTVAHAVGNDSGAAAVLVDYHRAKNPVAGPTVYPVSVGVRAYQFSRELDEEAKPMMVPFMSPIIHECYAPVDNEVSEKVCIAERMTKVGRDVAATADTQTLIREFVQLVVPTHLRQTLTPVEVDEVFERQAKPSQRHILEEAVLTEATQSAGVKMFMKREAYQDVKPPRPIQTFPPAQKLRFSQVVYALAGLVKQHCKWYAVGWTPKKIARKVAELAGKSKRWVMKTDYSKYDGTINQLMRELETAALSEAFCPEVIESVLDAHRGDYKQKGRGRHRTKYQQGYKRASGSPATALFNGMGNGFVAYATLRAMVNPETGDVFTPEEAYARLGLYSGDDGLTADVDPELYMATAAAWGLELKAEPVLRGARGVVFLSRHYGPYVWFGDENSCCDLKRQLSKIHATPALPRTVTPLMKLHEKMSGFYLSDRHTPVVGDLATKVVELCGGVATTDFGLRPWNSLAAADEQYPNERDHWMYDLLEEQLPTFDLDGFKLWLDKADQRTILSPPLCAQPSVPIAKLPVMVDGAVMLPPGATIDDMLTFGDFVTPAAKCPAAVQATARAEARVPARGKAGGTGRPARRGR